MRDQSKNLLRDLIDESLMVQKAKDLDINVETEIIKQLDDIRKKNNLATLEDLETEIEKQGLNYEDFKDNIRRNLLMREVMERRSRVAHPGVAGRREEILRGPQERFQIARPGALATNPRLNRKTEAGRSREAGERCVGGIEGGAEVLPRLQRSSPMGQGPTKAAIWA